MGSLHFIGGEKGGVGKSFVSRLLAQYLIDKGQSFIGFDTDQSHATFSRFYGEFTSPVDSKNELGFDAIIEAAEDNPNANILVDLAAQTDASLQQWMLDCSLGEIMSELDFRIYYWHVMDDGADSASLLSRLVENLEDLPSQLIVVQNYGRGKSFLQFEKSPSCQAARSRGAKFFLLAKLQEDLTQKIDFSSSSFWAAENNADAMKTVERHRMKVWLKFNFEQIDRVLNEPGSNNFQNSGNLRTNAEWQSQTL